MSTFSDINLIPGYNWAPKNLGRVLVLGLGKSGKAVASYCASLLGSRVESLFIAAGQKSDDALHFAEDMQAQGADVAFDYYEIDQTYDLCIASPGIPQTSDFYQSAQRASTELLSEVEFAWRECETQAKWVAITGTNGKTTTTALCSHLLSAAGFKAIAVGNIGDTCLEAVQAQAAEVYVAEVSSYQLASMKRFAPDVAVVMNITPDHLSWHGSMDEYVNAKFLILNNLSQREGAYAVLDATNDCVRQKVKEIKAQEARGYSYIAMGTKDGIQGDMRAACGADNAAFVDESGFLTIAAQGNEVRLCATEELLIPGQHNVGNALLASAAALCLGANAEALANGLRSFSSLEHRIEAAGSVNGVACYNDSKATNVDATLKALAAFEPAKPIVLLGGRDKQTDLSELVSAADAHCKAVVLYGESRERFALAFEEAQLPVYSAQHMVDAFDAACEISEAGDIILLSPACASFDEFNSFEHRGTVFKDLVAQRSKTG